MTKTGVLVMAYGTPSSRAEVAGYYTRIRHGRAPTDEQLADLVRRYDAIGGISPLAERTAAQVAGLSAALEERRPRTFDVRFGAKYADPDIEITARSFVDDEIDTVVGLALTPHASSMSTGEYLSRAEGALDEKATLLKIEHWYDAPGFAELIAARVDEALDDLDPAVKSDALVLFTAHSLPARILDVGDRYPEQVAESAQQVATAAGLGAFEVAWQSAGRTPEPWIGPDILEVIAALPDRGVRAVIICPIGFVADHLEVLYDVDVEAARVAAEAGVALSRTRSLNDDPAFLDLLAERVLAAVDGR
jgi:ferrochelatase